MSFNNRGIYNKCDRMLGIRWHKRFRDGEFNVNNSPITGRPFKTERDIAPVRDIVITVRRKTVREISDTTGMCANVVYPTIIHDRGIWKGCFWWLLLNDEQKEKGVWMSKCLTSISVGYFHMASAAFVCPLSGG